MISSARKYLLSIVLIAPLAGATEPTRMEITPAGNSYASGAELRITHPTAADLLAAGGRISVRGAVGADAALAGGAIDVRAPIRQDLRAAGGTISIEEDVGGELVAAGGSVNLENAATVAGSAWLAGRNVILAGTVGKGARIYADRIVLSGTIDGDAQLYAREIDILPTARITGNLVYASRRPLQTDAAARVQGTITREPMPDRADAALDDEAGSFAWISPLIALSMLATGALLGFLFPNAVAGVQRTIGQYPLRSLLIGLALLFTVPPLAVLCMATVIGIPIGLLLLALYPVMLLLGFLGVAFFIGRQAADAMRQPQQLGWGRQVLFLALALILLSALAWIPFLGGLMLILAVVIGSGGWAVWAYMRHDAGREAPA